MRLDRLKLALRRRSPEESLDLGLVMWRRWRGPVLRAWLATVVPFALLVFVLLPDRPEVAALIVWWLKPLFDRVLLKVYAEAVFDAPPTVRALWRALPGLLRGPGLLAGLTLRRFNPHRSFELPVWQLEGQRGKAARARLRVLGRKTRGHALWLTFVCIHCVVIFEFGIIALIEILRPSNAPPVFEWSNFFAAEQAHWQILVFNLAWLVAETIVEPVFVASGFSLYLNRRSELEGWDIEVAFRRMAERRAHEDKTAARQATAALILVAGLAAMAVTPTEASATEAASRPAPPAAAVERPPGAVRQAAEAVLADPVFGHPVEEKEWRYRHREVEKRTPPWWAEQLARIADLLAVGLRALLYVLVAFAGAALLVLLYRHRRFTRSDAEARPASVPGTLFGLDLRPASLPDDIPAAALAEIDSGRHAAALSLLYRGALASLIRRQRITFRAGDTEDACLRRIGDRVPPDTAGYFAELLEAWKRTAYARQPPDGPRARQLCQRWRQHFAPEAA